MTNPRSLVSGSLRRAALVLAAAVSCLVVGRASWADEGAPRPGAYSVTGSGDRNGAYAGTARIEETPDGLRLSLERRGGASLSGLLRRDGSKWRLETTLTDRGIVDALRGDPDLEATLRAEYERTADGGLAGTWDLRSGPKLLDRGAETLTPEPDGATVHVAVSVDWEGEDLAEANLQAIEAFRQALPDVPLTHFLNAAYFTKPGADRARVAAAIRRTLREGDETGLHVHAWRSLIEAAGVGFRREPTFWGGPTAPTTRDSGHDVEIAAYSVPELRRIVAKSREILTAAGFPISGSFRAGGWMADAGVLHAIRAEGFLIDSSATDPAWHDELAGLPLRARIAQVWPGVTTTSGPFVIRTPAGTILEMPDTGALADYTTAAEIAGHLTQALERAQADPGHDVYVHTGFHQETAHEFAPRVIEAIRIARARPGSRLVFETLESSAASALERNEARAAGATADPGGRAR